ncbi:putative peptidase [Streptococcus saliviloxodontae]|uniref:Peptidase n=1 Tax=Streptococcus saliviloxodontae TaxID=1349416 RepID=A0ABS2PNP9_9STRE|nr:putative peptidase [Streptococcus saliviloxodontae]
MRRFVILMLSFVTLLFVSGSALAEVTTPVNVEKTSIVVDSYEFGPAVSKVILKFDHKVTPAVVHQATQVTTAGVARQVTNSYVSDDTGHVIYFDSSQYVTLELNVNYNASDSSQNASPLIFDLSTWRNTWVNSYQVDMTDLSVVADGDTSSQVVSSSQDAMSNRQLPVTDIFSEQGNLSGMNYAAFSSNKTSQKRPLIVWLHGIGEVGTDITIPLTSNKVEALTSDQIQNHFTDRSGNITGSNVLVVQSPTAWSDTAGLKAVIDNYVAQHSEVDPSRIYLTGASNGGGMVLNMGITYPNYFAALVPISAPYSYQSSPINGEENYTLDEATKNALTNEPMWLVHSRADSTVLVDSSVLPFYKALLQSGATNKWLSYYESVVGTEMPGTTYDGHWSWVYFFNDQVRGVQNTENAKTWQGLYGMVATNSTQGGDAQATVNGQSYQSVFDWLNAQNLGNK